MLVMRNFGYLGLHSVIHSKSSLARDRLVDFTGETQIRRKRDTGDRAGPITSGTGNLYHVDREVSEWQKSFVSEPTRNGGRNLRSSKKGESSSVSESELYAQELAPLPLHASQINTIPSGPSTKSLRDRPSGEDIEPYFHTTFCNHMLLHPRQLINCPKGNIVVKVEMRDIEWIDGKLCHLPRSSWYRSYFSHSLLFMKMKNTTRILPINRKMALPSTILDEAPSWSNRPLHLAAPDLQIPVSLTS